jgi:hypothetical protein
MNGATAASLHSAYGPYAPLICTFVNIARNIVGPRPPFSSDALHVCLCLAIFNCNSSV